MRAVVLTCLALILAAPFAWAATNPEAIAVIIANKNHPNSDVPTVDFTSPATYLHECSDCPEMLLIPSGSFQMGVPEEESKREGPESVYWDNNSRPVHPVRIGQPFYLGKYHVTRGEYAAFARATGYAYEQPDLSQVSFRQTDDDPVVNVSWNDAQAYVAWLTRTTGKPYRLPSEAEWEYAARAGTTTARYWGDSADQQCQYANGSDLDALANYPGATVANCRDGYVFTSPVGHYEPNRFGLYDMLGNADQWVQDCFEVSGYSRAPSDGSVRDTGFCANRVVRGSSCMGTPRTLRSGSRYWYPSSDRLIDVGFRVARTFTHD